MCCQPANFVNYFTSWHTSQLGHPTMPAGMMFLADIMGIYVPDSFLFVRN
jgi:hypothetical protein